MLVYGDPQFPASFCSIKRRLQQASDLLPTDLDQLRRTLIRCGQLEQALADADPQWTQRAQTLTDTIATTFFAAWNDVRSASSSELSDVFNRKLDLLSESIAPETPLTIKVPEGFAFYALFPEQYCAAALEWLRSRGPNASQSIMVIGIRSIGTTLSAVVAATLRAAGCEVTRLTVRPTGDPFARLVQFSLPAPQPGHIIIVDEGPGLSGSSMSAVADAAIEARFSRTQISFFPGHDHGPGPASTERVLANWRAIRQFHVRLEDMRWSGRTLVDDLCAKASELSHDECDHISNPDNGTWAFAKMKRRCHLRSGQSILWKFVGLGPFVSCTTDSIENAWAQLNLRVRHHWSPAPLGVFRGFVALPWVNGHPLTRTDFADPALLTHVAAYLAQTAGPPLAPNEQEKAHQRLFQMLKCNTEKSLGPSYAELASRFQEPAPTADTPTFANGDLAPHNWIRAQDGSLTKVGGLAHDLDHTLIGKQPLHWSVAGVIIDNTLNRRAASSLIAALAQNGISLNTAALDFYAVSYTAFRLGQSSISATWEQQGTDEQRRLRQSIRYYRSTLKKLLNAVHAKDRYPADVHP